MSQFADYFNSEAQAYVAAKANSFLKNMSALQLLPAPDAEDVLSGEMSSISRPESTKIAETIESSETKTVNFSQPNQQFTVTLDYGELDDNPNWQQTVEMQMMMGVIQLTQMVNNACLFGCANSRGGVLNHPETQNTYAPLEGELDGEKVTTWEDKMGAGSPDVAQKLIMDDLNYLWEQIKSKNPDLPLSNNADLIVAIAPGILNFLSFMPRNQAIPFGDTTLTLVATSSLNEDEEGDNRLLMICQPRQGKPVNFCAFDPNLTLSKLERNDSGYHQTLTATTAGAFITKPQLFAWMSGI